MEDDDIFQILKEGPPEIRDDGTLVWRDDEGDIHRDHGRPAVIFEDGDKYFVVHGKFHREGGLPAIVYMDGTEMYYEHGEKV